MVLKTLFLQNFRNYTKSEFSFGKGTTLIVGPNTSGKTNLLEGISLLSLGKSQRGEKDEEMIRFGQDVATVKGITNEQDLGVILARTQENGEVFSKKYLLNGVSKRRADFVGNLPVVLFSPLDLDIIIGSPFLRRDFLDNVLEQVNRDYRLAKASYNKALRQRNALLDLARETGRRNEKQFEYWDLLLISQGAIISQKREEFIEFVNNSEKSIFDFASVYDKSIISKQRLFQYRDAEMGAAATLVGPHRDDFIIHMYNNARIQTHNVALFGSRGQQRLVMLQLRLIVLSFIEKKKGERPLLLLDDIFSELDESHIDLVLEETGQQQTIITTTHKELVKPSMLKKMSVIELQ